MQKNRSATEKDATDLRLPSEHYWSESRFQEDMEHIFTKNWLFVAHASQIPKAGNYITLSIGRDPVMIVRDESGTINAMFNVCRHRGSILCDQPSGCVTKIVCPYHQWVYGLDGTLQNSRLMNEEFDKAHYPLHKIACEVVEGFIFICLSPTPRSFEPAREAFSKYFAPHDPESIKPCAEKEYTVAANWKTIFENNRECYHCATGHKEFCLSNFDFGMPGDPRTSDEFVSESARMQSRWQELNLDAGPVNFPNGEWFRLSRFPLKKGFLTESLDGQPLGPLIGHFPDYDIGSLRVVCLPNCWFHLNSDYVMTTRLIPRSATETVAHVVWYVRRDAEEKQDYDPDQVAAVWQMTSEQDWKLCENNQRGMESSRYAQGPLSHFAEQGISHFAQWYLSQFEGK